jgi:hypothetical protein
VETGAHRREGFIKGDGELMTIVNLTLAESIWEFREHMFELVRCIIHPMNYTLTLNRKDADNTLEIFRFFARQTKR